MQDVTGCLTIIDHPPEVWIDVDPQTTGLLAFGCVGAKGMDLMLITGDSSLNMSWAWFALCLAFGLSQKRKKSSESLSWNKSWSRFDSHLCHLCITLIFDVNWCWIVLLSFARIHQSGPDFLDVGLGPERIQTLQSHLLRLEMLHIISFAGEDRFSLLL